MNSILQKWIVNQPIRFQGVLLSAIRGCDSASKESASKTLVRFLRCYMLNPACGDAAKAVSFIEEPKSREQFERIYKEFFKEMDQLPLHFVMHLAHGAEIVGYRHPNALVREMWLEFYLMFCHKLHLNCESEEQLTYRLTLSEKEFGEAQ